MNWLTRHSVLLLVACLWLVVAGCRSTDPTRLPSARLASDDFGFTVTESARVGVFVRSKFDEGTQAIEEGEIERGITLLEEVIESAPGFAAAQINLGIAYQRQDELEPAEAVLRHAIETHPKHPVAHNELGIVLRRSGRFDEARESYERALALEPQFHFARKNLAVLCDLYLTDLRCALDNYRLYLTANPADENAEMWVSDLETRIEKGGN